MRKASTNESKIAKEVKMATLIEPGSLASLAGA
jgi:hypothetical protein